MEPNWTKQSLDEICVGFQKARILLTAAEIDIFTILSGQPLTVEEICAIHKFSLRGLTILLDALASMGLLKKNSIGAYSVESPVRDLMDRNNPGSFLPMALHRARMWRTWSNLTEIIRTGTSRDFIDKKKRTPEEMEAFIGAMHSIGLEKARKLAQALDLRPYRKMIDVGAASGTYIVSFLRQNDSLRATLFDLPEVIGMAKQKIESEGLSDRVDFVAGDYHRDSFPAGHDLALLSAVIHINSPEANRSLYSRLLRAMVSGGTILIRDFFLDETRTKPAQGAIFAVNMLVATTAGNSYTVKEVFEDLVSCGFIEPRLAIDGPNMEQVIMATRP